MRPDGPSASTLLGPTDYELDHVLDRPDLSLDMTRKPPTSHLLDEIVEGSIRGDHCVDRIGSPRGRRFARASPDLSVRFLGCKFCEAWKYET